MSKKIGSQTAFAEQLGPEVWDGGVWREGRGGNMPGVGGGIMPWWLPKP